MSNEAFSRVKIDAQLRDVSWNLVDGKSVRYEYVLPDGTRADYVLCNRHGHSLAVVEAKKATTNPPEAEGQALAYAKQLGVPFIFLANGEEVWFWEWEREAHPRKVTTFFNQADLERTEALRKLRVDPLTIPIDTKIAGRPYQSECIDALCQAIQHGRRKLLVSMATGTGKTRTAAAFIKRLFEANLVSRVLFLVDRITLAKQAEDAFAEYLPDYPAYVLRGGRRFQDEKRITVSTLQTFIGEYASLPSSYFQLIIVDECHRSIYGQWSGSLKHFDGIQVGLTATPCVLKDPDQLPDPEDGKFIRDTLRFFEVAEPTYTYSLKQAIQEGHLVPYHIFKAMTVKTAAEGGFEVKREELDWSAMDDDTRTEFETLFNGDDTITVDPSALERKFTIPERNRAIVREFRQVLEKGFAGKDGVRRVPMWGKTIVFGVTKRHAETLAQMFDQEFADKKPSPEVRYADFVVSGTGDGDSPDGMTKIKRFKDERFPQILVSVNMLDTGFDCPEVVNLVMARFTKSTILYQQMRGRGTRQAPHIKKPNFTLFDFVGVTDYHGDDEDMPEGGFVTSKPVGPTGKPRKLLVLDVNDHIDPTTRNWVTLDENGNFVLTDEQEAQASVLGLRFEAWLATQSPNADQLRWLRMMESQIRANVGDMESVELYHFTLPPFSLNGGLQRARQLFGDDAKLEAMLASLNAAVLQDETVGDHDTASAPAH
ncbi:type I restriction enzyme R subunit [Azospirillum lipoferum]|uniref:DEAD/DEAH box helicase n=1 Tax=Azospirillum lipoferum TaxID=193 RepID=A0A5A9GJS1_AZOLI|nr:MULTISPECIES: DEAD/DEAH box helicase family protein [Azospirillum]KAA0593964.1 DEAD/DEAH box helicase [Azospirillum lipoferum]MCP1612439.1 type I restriction enzyme R subunit [Azospirillum lipoferum]MDW5531777.1 DEAD/DEAH box helicase family protein [Azospirillum sp. NL1]